MFKKNLLITITGPSGIGKGYLKNYLKYYFGLQEVAVYTTRKRRIGENSTDRIFINKDEFNQKNKKGELIFINKIYNNLYGFDINSFKNIEKRKIITELYIDNVSKFRKNIHLQ